MIHNQTLTGFRRLDGSNAEVRKQLRDLVGIKLFDQVFKECVSVKQTNQLIDSFVDTMIGVAEGHNGPRPIDQVIKTMKKINPLARHVFEDSDNTQANDTSIANMYTVTYVDHNNHEHTIQQRAFSPRSVRKRLEKMGFDVKDIVLASTGESVVNEARSTGEINRQVTNAKADIAHLEQQIAEQTNIFSKNLLEAQLAGRRKELDALIQRGEGHDNQWNEQAQQMVKKKKTNKQARKFQLTDAFKK